MHRLAHILFSLLLLHSVSAQHGITGHPSWQIKPAFNQGFVLVHRISIGHLVRGYPAIYELNFSKPTLGNKLWHLQNNLPDLGISVQCVDYKNPTQLGYGFVVAPYVEIPTRHAGKKARMVIRLSWGLAYLTKKFDISSNRKNIAIGSHFNAYTQFKWFWQIPLSPRLRFEPGFSFSHASNGKFRNPNLGLNIVSVNAALNILFPGKPAPRVTRVDSSTTPKSRNEIMLVGAVGINERLTYTNLLGVYMLSGAYQFNKSDRHKFSAGTDIFYDQNYQEDRIVRTGEPFRGPDKLRASARLGYAYNVGRLSFPIELGYYVWQRESTDGNLVNRIGVRYYNRQGMVFHFGLRAHIAVAYNFEFGAGYVFGL